MLCASPNHHPQWNCGRDVRPPCSRSLLVHVPQNTTVCDRGWVNNQPVSPSATGQLPARTDRHTPAAVIKQQQQQHQTDAATPAERLPAAITCLALHAALCDTTATNSMSVDVQINTQKHTASAPYSQTACLLLPAGPLAERTLVLSGTQPPPAPPTHCCCRLMPGVPPTTAQGCTCSWTDTLKWHHHACVKSPVARALQPKLRSRQQYHTARLAGSC